MWWTFPYLTINFYLWMIVLLGQWRKMVRRKEVTADERNIIMQMVGEGYSYREIGLCINRSPSAVCRNVDKVLNPRQLRKRGRKPILSSHVKRAIVRAASNKPRSCADWKRIFNLPVHRKTVWTVLKQARYFVVEEKASYSIFARSPQGVSTFLGDASWTLDGWVEKSDMERRKKV